MTNVLNILPAAVGQKPPVLLRGRVSTLQPAPAHFTDPLFVVFDDWMPDRFFTFTDWPASHGQTLPPAGNEVLVAVNDEGDQRVVWWSGTTQFHTSWSSPTLTNSWANTGSPRSNASYLKDMLGFVHVRGCIGTGASGSVAFVLPSGFRPAATSSFPSALGAGDRTDIDSSGNVTGWRSGTNSLSLDGITFLAEN